MLILTLRARGRLIRISSGYLLINVLDFVYNLFVYFIHTLLLLTVYSTFSDRVLPLYSIYSPFLSVIPPFLSVILPFLSVILPCLSVMSPFLSVIIIIHYE